MKNWKSRPSEIAYLMNPAFCGALIYNVIREYKKESDTAFPFLLVYLILPLILHKDTREAINSRSQMQGWIEGNQPILIGFAKRAKNLVKITNEAIEFLLQTGYLTISKGAILETQKDIKEGKISKVSNEEIKECFRKGEHVARWFARSGTIETIYISWGIRP